VLVWEDVGCHVRDRRRKGQEVTLLQGICGVARSGDLVAIIGKQAVVGVGVPSDDRRIDDRLTDSLAGWLIG
jgi:hypothetical protein